MPLALSECHVQLEAPLQLKCARLTKPVTFCFLPALSHYILTACHPVTLAQRNDGALVHGDGTERRTVRSAQHSSRGEGNEPELLAPAVAEEGGGVGGGQGGSVDEDGTRDPGKEDDALVRLCAVEGICLACSHTRTAPLRVVVWLTV